MIIFYGHRMMNNIVLVKLVFYLIKFELTIGQIIL